MMLEQILVLTMLDSFKWARHLPYHPAQRRQYCNRSVTEIRGVYWGLKFEPKWTLVHDVLNPFIRKFNISFLEILYAQSIC